MNTLRRIVGPARSIAARQLPCPEQSLSVKGEWVRNLNGKVAVVTGASSGIGLALAQRLAADGMKLVLADIEEETLRQTELRLRASGASVVGVTTDVAHAQQVDELARPAPEAFGSVHVVCNNAGVGFGTSASIWDASLADWEWIVGVNMWGVVNGSGRSCRSCSNRMRGMW
jgi:NADP-dependent 3-hydroxy acid dehydrogenase YdfG